MEEPEDQALWPWRRSVVFCGGLRAGHGLSELPVVFEPDKLGFSEFLLRKPRSGHVHATCFSRWRDDEYYCVVTPEGRRLLFDSVFLWRGVSCGRPFDRRLSRCRLNSPCVGGSLSSPLSVSYTGGAGSPSYQWSDGSGVISGCDVADVPSFRLRFAGDVHVQSALPVSPARGGLRQRGSLPSTVGVLA